MTWFVRLGLAFVLFTPYLCSAQVRDRIPMTKPDGVKFGSWYYVVGSPTWAARFSELAKSGPGRCFYAQVYERSTKRLVIETPVGENPAGMTFCKPLVWNERLFFVYQKVESQGGGITVILQEVDPWTLQTVGDKRPFGSISFKTSSDVTHYEVPFIFSQDSSHVAFTVFGFQGPENEMSALMMVADHDLQPVWSKVHTIPIKAHRLEVQDVVVSNTGRVFASFLEYNGSLAASALRKRVGSRLYAFDAREEKEIPIVLPSGNSPDNVALSGSTYGAMVGGYATNDAGRREELRSTFLGSIHEENLQFKSEVESRFSEPLSGISSDVRLIPREDGGHFLVGGVISGLICHTLHVQSFAKDLQVEWQGRVPRKIQTSHGVWFRPIVQGAKLSLVFEDKEKNIGKLIAGEEPSLCLDGSGGALGRADFGSDGKPSYASYANAASLPWISLNWQSELANGERVACRPLKEGDYNGPSELIYFGFGYGEPGSSGK